MYLTKIIKHESFGGGLLVFAAVIAMLFANSPWSVGYKNFLELPVVAALGSFEIAKPLILWVNDGLMALFFLLIGLEIKREILEGNLSSAKQIVLPGVAAVAGIVFPALIYVFFNGNDPVALRGWAIPSATDIAFALGIFSVFGNRLPLSLKLFLLSVAIFDDIAAIIIIAVFYSAELSSLSLVVGLLGLIVLLLLNRFKISTFAPYFIVGIIVWVAVLKSGVHATLAGFAIAWFIPLKLNSHHGEPMLKELEHSLHPWIGFFVLPLFAFANAGIDLRNIGMEALFSPITLGIALGLFIGKQIGIFGVCWAVIKLKITEMPEGATWTQFYGVSLLCGIGFTMSLFIGTLAFEEQALSYQVNVKLGVLIGSFVSAILAVGILYASSKPAKADCYNQKEVAHEV